MLSGAEGQELQVCTVLSLPKQPRKKESRHQRGAAGQNGQGTCPDPTESWLSQAANPAQLSLLLPLPPDPHLAVWSWKEAGLEGQAQSLWLGQWVGAGTVCPQPRSPFARVLQASAD